MKFITIIGVGLIGSSIARKIRAIDEKIQINIIDNSKENLEKSKLLKLGNIFSLNIDKQIENSDIIFLCTPISAYEKILHKLNNFELSNTIISDVGSSKVKVTKLAESILKNKIFVPGHPIAGTEKSGPENGLENLFKDKWFISTNCNLCNEKSLEYINSFWKKLGSKTITMKSKDHDSIMAITSHIPHLIAYNIVGTASELGENIKSEVIKFSASGFRDFTRIASSDPVMWRDIMLSNKEEIISLFEKFNDDLKQILNAIKKDDGEFLVKKFKKTREIREKIIEAGFDKN
tara:strand:- start:1792 stop:2664 length:873 start_codon:yes stop_codon:yes gene_type:complete